MATKFQTSFIPKAPVVGSRGSNTGVNFFMLISVIIFLVSLGLSAYVYLEKNNLIQNIKSVQNTISTNKNGIISDQNTIENIINLDNRINVAKQLLAQHISISPIFDFLQQATIQDVRFNSFSFSAGGKDSNGNNTVKVNLTGVGRSWESVASQESEFDLPDWKNIISNSQLSNFGINPDGSISFSFSADIDPQFLLYANTENNNSAAASTTTQ